MKKFLVLAFGLLMMFLTSSVFACENCDCGCQNGEKCNCKKECVKDCDCDCHKSEKCNKADCDCGCHKKCKCHKKCNKDCNCGCQNGEKCTCKDDCKCGCKKSKKSIKNIFKRNKIKCNCEE